MVTIDELVEVKVENAEADERLWSSLRGMHEGQAEGLKQVAATAERGIAENRSAADNAAANAAEAKERVERLKRGEDVPGGLGKPVDFDQICRDAGLSAADLRHYENVAALPEEVMPTLRDMILAESERARRRLVRMLLRRLNGSDDGDQTGRADGPPL